VKLGDYCQSCGRDSSAALAIRADETDIRLAAIAQVVPAVKPRGIFRELLTGPLVERV
jgi:hypothetical protein